MNAIKTVMVAIGFSDYSKEILNYAAAMANPLNADLLVASVINSRDVEAVQAISAMGYDVDGEHYVSGIRSEREQMLAAFLKDMDFPRDRVKSIIRLGNPIDELLKITVKENVDLVVMGIKGRSDLEHALVGSVAEKMFRRSPIAVLSYRDKKSQERLRKHIDAI